MEWEIRSFLSQKVNVKMIFFWSFLAFMIFQDLGNMAFRAVLIFANILAGYFPATNSCLL